MNRLKKAAKTRLKQIKKEVKALLRESRAIDRLFGRRKRRTKKAKAAAAPRKRKRAKKTAAPVAQAA